jgi:hypothetical protein
MKKFKIYVVILIILFFFFPVNNGNRFKIEFDKSLFIDKGGDSI